MTLILPLIPRYYFVDQWNANVMRRRTVVQWFWKPAHSWRKWKSTFSAVVKFTLIFPGIVFEVCGPVCSAWLHSLWSALHTDFILSLLLCVSACNESKNVEFMITNRRLISCQYCNTPCRVKVCLRALLKALILRSSCSYFPQFRSSCLLFWRPYFVRRDLCSSFPASCIRVCLGQCRKCAFSTYMLEESALSHTHIVFQFTRK